MPAPKPSRPADRPGAPPASGPTRVGRAPIAPGSSPPPEGVDLPLPHERDEAAGQVPARHDPVIEQARRDLESGRVDTDLRSTPGLDAERRHEMVPTPAPQEARDADDARLAAKGVGPGAHPKAGAADRHPPGSRRQ